MAALIRAKAQRAGAVITGEKTGTNQPDEAGEIPASDIAAEQTADSRDRDDAGWLTEEADSPALIARNVTAQTVTARIGCRVRGDVQFRDDVRLAGHEQTRWTDLPDAESFEIAVVPDHGDSATLHVEESEAVDGDIQIYLAPQEVSIDTTATEDTPSSDTTNSRTATRTQDSREQQEAVSTPESKTSSSRLRGLIVTSIGLVVWFGSLALAPEVLLPALGTEPRFAPSQAELLGQIEEAVAVFGFLVTIYGVFRIVKPK